MDRKELESILRGDFANKIKPIVIKKYCEKCGAEDDLVVHHDTRFCELLDKALIDLHIKKENYSELEIRLVRNYFLGLQLKTKLITLCNDCHTQLHIGLGGYSVDRKKRVSNCANIILKYIDNRLSTEGKWTRIKSNDVMKELNIKSNNWTKIWNNEVFIDEVKKRRIKQSLKRAGEKLGNRKVNWMIKY